MKRLKINEPFAFILIGVECSVEIDRSRRVIAESFQYLHVGMLKFQLKLVKIDAHPVALQPLLEI